MTEYIVLYRIKDISSDLDAPFGFQFWAEDGAHAEEQCINAYPDADVVWVVPTEQYSEALEEYYGSSINY